MNVNPEDSAYVERTDTRADFTPAEALHCRTLLRRLRWLEHNARDPRRATDMHVEKELQALEWVLTEIEFLTVQKEKTA